MNLTRIEWKTDLKHSGIFSGQTDGKTNEADKKKNGKLQLKVCAGIERKTWSV